MSHRFLVYPLLFVILAQLIPLLRDEPRWFLAPIIQRILILLACGFAMGEAYHNFWIVAAWGLTIWLISLPKIALQSAQGWLTSGEIDRAAKAWRGAAWFAWGKSARLYRRFATALHLWSTGQEAAADAMLDQIEQSGLPESVRGEVRLWRLHLMSSGRDWSRVASLYEHAGSWGLLSTALEARLIAARAYAELGDFPRAILCLHLVALSPRAMGALERHYWITRICVAGIAGAREELEWLLARLSFQRRRGLTRFAAVWRGRCALAQGDREEAGRQFSRALALTPASLPKSRQIIAGYMDQSDTGTPVAVESCRHGFAQLREADNQMSAWRGLMHWGRPPVVTAMLLALLGIIFVADDGLNRLNLLPRWWMWGGNVPLTEMGGEWWRPVTALFLHANWLHLVLNGAALWMFGSAIEKSFGRVRLLVIFLVAGTVANVASAQRGGFDVSVGASGAVFGLVAAFGVAVYRLKSPIPSSVRRRLLMMLGLMLTVDLTIGGLESQIDNTAHIVGFLAGFVLALVSPLKD